MGTGGSGNAPKDSGMLQMSQIWGHWKCLLSPPSAGTSGKFLLWEFSSPENKARALPAACLPSRREFQLSPWVWGVLGWFLFWGRWYLLVLGLCSAGEFPRMIPKGKLALFGECRKNCGWGGAESWKTQECARKRGMNHNKKP